jgi:hypothetical protein
LKTIQIAGRNIGINYPPFVIAEMSGNHNQSLNCALETVEVAAKTGAHALKIQTYTPDTMTIDLDEREFHIGDSQQACGRVLRSTSCTAKPIPRGSGINQSSIARASWALFLSVRHYRFSIGKGSGCQNFSE